MDLKSTFAHDTFKQDGMVLFIETMTDPKADPAKVAADLQTLFESAWSQRGQAAGQMMLSRLTGYVQGMANVVSGIQQAGVQFLPVTDADGKLVDMRLKLFPAEGAKPGKLPRQVISVADLDKLEGPDYEAALENMPEAEREKYLAADD